MTLATTLFTGNAAGDQGGAVALLGKTGENRVSIVKSPFTTNEADVGADVSVSSPNLIAADFSPDDVRGEALPGHQWAPVPLAQNQTFEGEQLQPLLRGNEAWITSADVVSPHPHLGTLWHAVAVQAGLLPCSACCEHAAIACFTVEFCSEREPLPRRCLRRATSLHRCLNTAARGVGAARAETLPSSCCPA